MQGLLLAMETLFPTVEHRYCVKHIYNNFKVNHKGMELKSVLWRCVETISVKEFERRMEHLKSMEVPCKYRAYTVDQIPLFSKDFDKLSGKQFKMRVLTL